MSKFNVIVICWLLSLKAWGQCNIFPENNIWNTKVADAPIHRSSDKWLESIGLNKTIHPDFGRPTIFYPYIGIPINYTNKLTTKHKVKFTYATESDNHAYPIPFMAKIEGGFLSKGDRHIISFDTDTCLLYELFNAHRSLKGEWSAGSGAIFNLKTNDLRPTGWTSADAAGLPIYPGLVRFEELNTGSIDHALRFTTHVTSKNYIWPARHFASKLNDTSLPPMGIRLRLKVTFDTSKLSPQAKIIAKALQEYGMILADNGASLFITGEPNENWDNDDLRSLKQIKATDFEVIDVSKWQLSKNSAEAQITQ